MIAGWSDGVEHFAGYLGFTSSGVIAIHANRPAYPAEHCWEVALVTLGNFPIGPRFRAIDDIDRCLLFVADGTVRGGDDFSPEAMHVAIWHEDLLLRHLRSTAAGGGVRGVDAPRIFYRTGRNGVVIHSTGQHGETQKPSSRWGLLRVEGQAPTGDAERSISWPASRRRSARRAATSPRD